MNTRALQEVQAELYHSDTHRKRHRARLIIARQAIRQPDSAAPHALKPLSVPAFLVSSRSKRGDVRSVVMFNANAAVMLARRSRGQPFSILTKIKTENKWQKHAGSLQGGPLHRSINTAQEFLLRHGSAWKTGERGFRFPTKRTLQILDYFDIATPRVCSADTVSALIHAYHFGRTFDAMYQSRPWINGFEAREVSFKELQNSQ